MKRRIARRRRGRCPSYPDKVTFRDHESAARALAAIRQHPSASGEKPQRAYQCPACNGWHLTKEK